jgi:hypothetical protein
VATATFLRCPSRLVGAEEYMCLFHWPWIVRLGSTKTSEVNMETNHYTGT